jgi:hypothetical protein
MRGRPAAVALSRTFSPLRAGWDAKLAIDLYRFSEGPTIADAASWE